MLLLYDRGVGALVDPQDELGLLPGHLRVEAPWVHAKGVDILFSANVSVEARACPDGCVNHVVLSPTPMSQRPTMTLIIKIDRCYTPVRLVSHCSEKGRPCCLGKCSSGDSTG